MFCYNTIYPRIDESKKKTISFGTTLDRGLFPHICAPDRTGNELYPLRGAPHRGPGCYNNAEVSSFTYNLSKWVSSKRGYTYGSRTDPRFRKIHEMITPSPTAYQTKWIDPTKPKTAYKPFETSALRFKQLTQDPMITPGPGIYEHDVPQNRKIQWPQQFGAPVKPIQPDTLKRTLKTELLSDMEARKFRNKVAYFQLYFT
ncbi:ciliary microtubule-associated protein 3-like isoform X2 [Clavelina lepadiformis]|uniref:ciliary microtubule-associated protein 3-like isoform X2 n=1 Tax=Clavelina lepadiformis TaxID=159417 RepID=UPI00404191CA